MQRIKLNNIKDGVNSIDEYLIYKNGDIINVCRNQCKHMGGKFKKCGEENIVSCIRHNWKLNLETLEYINPKSIIQDSIKWKIDGESLIIYDDVIKEKYNNAKLKLDKNEFRIKFYTHACIEIKWKEYSFFTDPWLIGPAFTKGWWLTHKPPEDWLYKLANCDGIYFSHNHPDHMNIPTLKKLVKENPSVSIFIPGFESDSCYRILSSLGFTNINTCEFGEIQELNDACFTIYQDTAGKDDSALLFEYKGHKILNTVDCKNIKTYNIKNVDILLAEFASGASGFPVCWNEQYDDKIIEDILNRHRKQMYRNISDSIYHFKPSVFIPFAGYFSEEYWSDYKIKQKNIKNNPKDIIKFVEKKFKEIKTWYPVPGNELDISNFLTYKYSGKYYYDEHPDYYAEEIKSGEHIDEFNDTKNIQTYFDMIGYESDLVLHIIEMDEEFLNIINEFYVDFNSGKVLNYKPDNYERYLKIKVRSDVFRYVLYNGLSWEEFSIGFQARFYREPDNYNLDFWNHFQNSIPKNKIKELF